MKKHLTRSEVAKRKKTNLISALLLAFLMITSIAGYMSNRNPVNVLRYNNFVFRQEQDNYGNLRWYSKIEGKQFVFDYNPKVLENINLSPVIRDRILSSKYVIITFQPSDRFTMNYFDRARYDFGSALYEKGINAASAIANSSDEYNLPIITCANSTQQTPVIYMFKGNKTEIRMESDCIVLECSENYEILALKDRLLYSILGVMK
ncbi:MAG: hypothetical protein ACP5OZ_00095 [Candidatus Woesearchaeota archaeon]